MWLTDFMFFLFSSRSSSIFFHVDFQTSTAAQTDVEGHVRAVPSGTHSQQRTVNDGTSLFYPSFEFFVIIPMKINKMSYPKLNIPILL